MPVLNNQRWECFARALFEGKSADEAYETAGYSPNRGNASRLKANENILTRVTELQLEAQKKSEVTVESLLAELETARAKATDLNQLSAAVRATAEKAKISGLLIERVEVGPPGAFDAMTDDELERALIERLSALGLTPDAGSDTRH